MATPTVPGRKRAVGKVVTSLTVVNRVDQAEAERGHRSADEVRSEILEEVRVDTGATLLALPSGVIARLGLALRETVPILTAAGPGTARLFQDAALTVLGRSGAFGCVELPATARPLLGAIPLEVLGLELDVQKQELRRLPFEPGDTYYTV